MNFDNSQPDRLIIFLYIFIVQGSSVVCKQVRQSVHNIPWHLNADAMIVQVTYYILAHDKLYFLYISKEKIVKQQSFIQI